MADEKAQGAGQGAATGAATGATVGSVFGPWGTAIGAVVGAIVGGVGGLISGGHRAKAAKKMKQAKKLQQQREADAYKQSFLSQIRQARIARESALATAVAAGAEEGTGSQGAMASYGSQTANIAEYLSVDRERALKIAQLKSGAEKNLSTAKTVDAAIQGATGVVYSAGEAYGSYKNQQKEENISLKKTGGYRFNSDNSLTIGEGMPYLNGGKVSYVPQGSTKTLSYK